MAKLTFYGATGTVTGSRYLLEIGNNRLLIDCGLFQGPKRNRLRNWDPFPVPPESIDRVLLTHAHIDHTGYLPRFCRYDFKGKIHSTHATADLCQIMLHDSAHLQEEDARWANKKGYSKHSPALPLYTIEDAEKSLQYFAPVNYGEHLEIDENTRVKFKDAGHILGSSFLDVKTTKNGKSRKIMFSGDFGRPDRPVLREPVQVFDVDYLVLESTYGNRLHEEVDPEEELADIINKSVDRGGVLVVPAFAVGRTQTLLYVLRELEEDGKIPELPVFVDSPMAINTTEIFRKHLAEINLASRVLTLKGKQIFHPKHLKICRSRDESIAINKHRKPAIIISASGMATGGRILHHLRERLPHPENTILFIGYQAEGTRGRALLEGTETIKMHGKKIPVKAQIANIFGFSGHADYDEMLAWLLGLNRAPEKVFIVHGEPEASASLREKIQSRFGWDVVIPELGESFDLDL